MAYIGIWDKVKRARAGIKGLYGVDSSKYEMAGGSRLSERKKPRQNTILKAKKTNRLQYDIYPRRFLDWRERDLVILLDM